MKRAYDFFIQHKKLTLILGVVLIDLILFAIISTYNQNYNNELKLFNNHSFELLGNYTNISIYGEDTDEAFTVAEELARNLSNQMTNELHTVLTSQNNISHTLSPESFDLLASYADIHNLEDTILLDAQTFSCTLNSPLEINISFLIKGYIADYINTFIANTYKYEYSTVKIGNIIASQGNMPSSHKQVVTLSNPVITDTTQNIVGYLELQEKSLVTVYAPATVPKENELFYTTAELNFPHHMISITLTAPTAFTSVLVADKLSTLPDEDWITYVESLNDTGLIILNKDHRLQVSNGIRDYQFEYRNNYKKDKATQNS